MRRNRRVCGMCGQSWPCTDVEWAGGPRRHWLRPVWPIVVLVVLGTAATVTSQLAPVVAFLAWPVACTAALVVGGLWLRSKP